MSFDECQTGIESEFKELMDNFQAEYQSKSKVLLDAKELIRMRINRTPFGQLGILSDIDQGVIKFEQHD